MDKGACVGVVAMDLEDGTIHRFRSVFFLSHRFERICVSWI